MSSIRDIRTDYTKGELSLDAMLDCPAEQLSLWIEEATSEGVGDPNAFCLSTLRDGGMPTGRIVLARGVDASGIVFYTNKQSSKGDEIEKSSKASATFFWQVMQRQARFSGIVKHLSDSESDAYFASRPRASQIGAWASDQSSTLSSRKELEEKYADFEAKFDGIDVPRPTHWGGYVIEIIDAEFWQGRASRLHDRVRYEKEGSGWKKVLLQP